MIFVFQDASFESLQSALSQSVYFHLSQVLKYLDYVFTGVFTFEMVIKVRERPGSY